ncbi:hypothetical protein DPMN_081145 [Dreissena polymorpha]|uniref:Uncharacterized protein n=1 Tax=Dreissena polymorpha TaxID=45954 RepID=A0A9D3Y8C3_DREPO|nr:hypothetical protein DPMN_081145 [Dreissena polymorpha]
MHWQTAKTQMRRRLMRRLTRVCAVCLKEFLPDLAPMDFRVFPEVKSQLRGIRFASKQELTVAAKRIVLSFDADWYRDTFDKWISRHIKCIRVGGINERILKQVYQGKNRPYLKYASSSLITATKSNEQPSPPPLS